jgi:hypothetical protein
VSARPIWFLTWVALLGSPLLAADLDTYRGFTLGTSSADVLALAGASPQDLKTLHERPAVIEELSWRPSHVPGRTPGEGDSIATIVFSFVDDHLFKMAIDYDRSRTEGLTSADLIASLTTTYGARSTLPAPRRPQYDSLAVPSVVAMWRQRDATIALQRLAYTGGFSLVITSVPLDTLARQAQLAAAAMDAREAPARAAASAKAAADAARANADTTRRTNKATFQP